MRRPMTLGLLLATACGARLSGNPAEVDRPDAMGAADAALPDMAPDAAQLRPWSTPAKVGPAATAAAEDDVTLSSDALEMIFAVQQATNGKDLFYTSRPAIGAPWTTPAIRLTFDTTTSSEETPRFSGDDRTLYFASDRGTSGSLDIYMVTRPAAGSTAWGTPIPVTGAINTTATEKWFAPCTGGRYVVVRSVTNAGTDLFEGTLGGAAPAPIASLNSTADEISAFLTQDCLTIYFASSRTTPERIFTSHRAAIGDPWPAPTEVDDFKIGTGTDNQEDPWLSPDGNTFAFASNAAGNKDIYLSTR